MVVRPVTDLDVGAGVDMAGSNSVNVQSRHGQHSLCIRPKAEAVQVGVGRLGNVKAVWTMFDLREMSPDRNIGASWTIAQRRG